jgi:hypothetical protein
MALQRLTYFKTFVLAVVVVAVFLTVYFTLRVLSDRPVSYDDDREHFKYGSTGGERGYKLQPGFGLPYWMWVAFPEVFADLLPDVTPGRGYESFGMLYEDGRDPRFDLPIGMSMRTYMGVDRVYFTCSSCHTGSVRDSPEAEPTYVLGMPANVFDLGRLARFLFDLSADERFTPTYLMPKIRALAELRDRDYRGDAEYRPRPFDAVDRLAFDLVGVYLVRDRLLNIRGQLAFIDTLAWGPGRVDTFNSPKALLGFPMENAPPEELVGIADFPSVWFQQGREGMELHWDGNNSSVDERNLSAGFGTGATPTTLDKERVLRIRRFLWDQAAPPPFPADKIDPALAERGAPIYRRYCWGCHGNSRPPFEGETVGTVVPIAEIGTDRWRLDSYTPRLAAAQNTLYAGFPKIGLEACAERPPDDPECYPARFHHFKKTWGYANMPLDGIWLRAPYLHNGSVPSLRDLLEPSAERPTSFYLGNDVYDYENVGFVHDAAEANGRRLFRLAVLDDEGRWVPGNGNYGHEGPEYGTELPDEDKAALVEYLKTF